MAKKEKTAENKEPRIFNLEKKNEVMKQCKAGDIFQYTLTADGLSKDAESLLMIVEMYDNEKAGDGNTRCLIQADVCCSRASVFEIARQLITDIAKSSEQDFVKYLMGKQLGIL